MLCDLLPFFVLQVDVFQSETDKLAASLKNIEKYNEEMKGEIAVTKR